MAWNNQTKNLNEVIYFVMEDGFYYLVGSDEDLVLVTQDEISWNGTNRNTAIYTNINKS